MKLIINNISEDFYSHKFREDLSKSSKTFFTYWQLVLNVDTKEMRKNLLRKNIETSSSNLSNLFLIYKNKIKSKSYQSGTNNLFSKTIFFPLNNDLTKKDLIKNIVFGEVIKKKKKGEDNKEIYYKNSLNEQLMLKESINRKSLSVLDYILPSKFMLFGLGVISIKKRHLYYLF